MAFLCNGISVDKWHWDWQHGKIMKATTTIDGAGRLVIPKPFRDEHGLKAGQSVCLVDSGEGILIAIEPAQRRFIKRGRILAIDTGAGTAPLSSFDVSEIREQHLRGKAHGRRR